MDLRVCANPTVEVAHLPLWRTKFAKAGPNKENSANKRNAIRAAFLLFLVLRPKGQVKINVKIGPTRPLLCAGLPSPRQARRARGRRLKMTAREPAADVEIPLEDDVAAEQPAIDFETALARHLASNDDLVPPKPRPPLPPNPPYEVPGPRQPMPSYLRDLTISTETYRSRTVEVLTGSRGGGDVAEDLEKLHREHDVLPATDPLNLANPEDYLAAGFSRPPGSPHARGTRPAPHPIRAGSPEAPPVEFVAAAVEDLMAEGVDLRTTHGRSHYATGEPVDFRARSKSSLSHHRDAQHGQLGQHAPSHARPRSAFAHRSPPGSRHPSRPPTRQKTHHVRIAADEGLEVDVKKLFQVTETFLEQHDLRPRSPTRVLSKLEDPKVKEEREFEEYLRPLHERTPSEEALRSCALGKKEGKGGQARASGPAARKASTRERAESTRKADRIEPSDDAQQPASTPVGKLIKKKVALEGEAITAEEKEEIHRRFMSQMSQCVTRPVSARLRLWRDSSTSSPLPSRPPSRPHGGGSTISTAIKARPWSAATSNGGAPTTSSTKYRPGSPRRPMTPREEEDRRQRHVETFMNSYSSVATLKTDIALITHTPAPTQSTAPRNHPPRTPSPSKRPKSAGETLPASRVTMTPISPSASSARHLNRPQTAPSGGRQGRIGVANARPKSAPERTVANGAGTSAPTAPPPSSRASIKPITLTMEEATVVRTYFRNQLLSVGSVPASSDDPCTHLELSAPAVDDTDRTRMDARTHFLVLQSQPFWPTPATESVWDPTSFTVERFMQDYARLSGGEKGVVGADVVVGAARAWERTQPSSAGVPSDGRCPECGSTLHGASGCPSTLVKGGADKNVMIIMRKTPASSRTAVERRRMFRELRGMRALEAFQDGPVWELCGILEHVVFEANRLVFKQGDAATAWYIILSGSVSVQISQSGRLEDNRLIRKLSKGDGFGDLALVHNIPRTATITTDERTELMKIEKDDYNRILRFIREKEMNELYHFIRKMPVFANWTRASLMTIVANMRTKKLEPGQIIYKQGIHEVID
ncbi:hypothetical protein HK101_000534 [Irineochytrium annulatum]|nr:hypothetical protein HK101_000534 [Irineochytrium annulatum]